MKLRVSINKSYVREDGKCAVRMSVSKDGEREWYTFPFAVEPAKWDSGNRRVRPGGHAVEYNRTIQNMLSRAEVLGLEAGITAKAIVEQIKLQGTGERPLITVAMRKAVTTHTERFGEGSRVVMETMIRDVEKSLPEIKLGELTSQHVQQHHRSMKDRGLSHNTISKRLRNFRTAYNTALVDNGQERTRIFHGIIPKEKATRKRMLKEGEIARLASFQCDVPRLMLAKHAFLLQVFLGGMRIGDLITLKPSMIRKREGVWELDYDMRKTGDARWVKVPEQAVDLIEHYKGEGHVLPLYTGPKRHDINYATMKVNGPLKIIAAACDLPRDLSTHYARHTFGDWARKNKVPLKTLQMIFGHKDIKTTMIYMSSFDTDEVSETYDLLSKTMPKKVV